MSEFGRYSGLKSVVLDQVEGKERDAHRAADCNERREGQRLASATPTTHSSHVEPKGDDGRLSMYPN